MCCRHRPRPEGTTTTGRVIKLTRPPSCSRYSSNRHTAAASGPPSSSSRSIFCALGFLRPRRQREQLSHTSHPIRSILAGWLCPSKLTHPPPGLFFGTHSTAARVPRRFSVGGKWHVVDRFLPPFSRPSTEDQDLEAAQPGHGSNILDCGMQWWAGNTPYLYVRRGGAIR